MSNNGQQGFFLGEEIPPRTMLQLYEIFSQTQQVSAKISQLIQRVEELTAEVRFMRETHHRDWEQAHRRVRDE